MGVTTKVVTPVFIFGRQDSIKEAHHKVVSLLKTCYYT